MMTMLPIGEVMMSVIVFAGCHLGGRGHRDVVALRISAGSDQDGLALAQLAEGASSNLLLSASISADIAISYLRLLVQGCSVRQVSDVIEE